MAVDRSRSECTGEGVRQVAQQEGAVRDWWFTLEGEREREGGREGGSRLGDATWTRDLWLIPRQQLAGAFGSFPDEPGGQRGGGGGGGLARSSRTNLALLFPRCCTRCFVVAAAAAAACSCRRPALQFANLTLT